MAESAQPARLIRRREVERRIGHARSTLYGWIETGRFPRPVRTGPRSVAWLESEVDSWIVQRAGERGAA